MKSNESDLQALSAIVGQPVLAFERSPWGFENHTDIVTLADGRKLVVQRVSNHALAPQKLRLAQLLPERLAEAGIRMPRQLAADATADPPYAVREYLPGVTAASLMRDMASAAEVAGAMGGLLRRLQGVRTAGLPLPDAWADPARLARRASEQLARCHALVGEPGRARLSATIERLAGLFAGRGACFAHGDFCPVNALVERNDEGRMTKDEGRATDERRKTKDERRKAQDRGLRTTDERRKTTDHGPQTTDEQLSVIGLLDVEFARLADPLFDAAWWGWVVRYHHYERWVVAWPRLLAAAGIDADAAALERMRAIQRLRCLEMADEARTASAGSAAMWARRLGETLEWSD